MARKSRKQTAAPMPAPSLYVHVALYIRLSVEDNKKRGCSVENQKLVLNDFLSDKPDFVVYDTYIDNGATGTNFHRPGFQQMLSDIEAGHINCVIVKDLSRLGRNSIDTGYYIEQYFHAHNVRFIAVTDQFDTADSGNLHGGIMLPLKNMINEAYALDIGRKIKAQARQAMKDGDYIGARAPYGYRKDPDNCHKLLIDENTAPVVKQIFEWAHEHVSLNRIVRNLNEMGIPAPSHYKKTTGEITSPGLIGSGKWQTRTVMKILESEVYTGDLVQGKTKIVDHQQVKAVICPYGYRKSADGRMEPDEDVAPNVQMIFQWASEGNTAAEITRKLYAMNIPTPGEYRKLKGKDYYNVSRTNGVWSTSTVLRILEDQRYIGTYVIGKRKVKEIGSRHTQLKDESEWFKIPNHHPAIVSVDLFEKANASIKRFSLLNKKPRDYLLRGKVFCGCCDHAMSLRNGAWFYCRHSEVAETLPCHGVRIKMADLEQVVFETIRAQMCPALGIDSNKDKLDLQTVQQAEHEEKLRSIQDSKRHLYEQYALGEIDLETYRTRKAVYDTELVQAKNVHAVITAQTKQIKSDYEIKLKQQEIVQEVGNANMLTKALIDRLINKVYVFPGDRIEIEYATQDFLETKESEKEV